MGHKMYFLATALLIAEVSSQLAGVPCGRGGGGAMRPTGPIIPAGQFVLPAVIRPVLPGARPCQPAALPVPPAQPCLDFDDDEDPYDDLLFTLITTFLDSKNPGRKTGRKGKSYDFDDDECEDVIVPSLYSPAGAAASPGAGAAASPGAGAGAAPCAESYADREQSELIITLRPIPTSQDV